MLREGGEQDRSKKARAKGNLARKAGVSAEVNGATSGRWRGESSCRAMGERGYGSVVCPGADLGSRVLREEGQAIVKR